MYGKKSFVTFQPQIFSSTEQQFYYFFPLEKKKKIETKTHPKWKCHTACKLLNEKLIIEHGWNFQMNQFIILRQLLA